MSKRGWLNFSLFVVVAMLLAVVIYEPGLENSGATVRPIKIKADAISKIGIHRIQEAPITLSKKDSAWEVELTLQGKPRVFSASQWKIEQLLGVTAIEGTFVAATAKSDLKQFGLNQGRIRLFINDKEIQFGDVNSLNRQRYIEIDKDIYLVKESVYTHLISEDIEYLDKALLPTHPTIVELKLSNIQVAQDENGRWQVSPAPAFTFTDAAQQLVDEWRFAQAMSIQFQTKSESNEKVEIKPKHGDDILFYVSRTDKGFSLFRPDWGLVYHFPNDSWSRLFSLPEKPNHE